MEKVSTLTSYLILIAHFGLCLWGMMGLFEYLTGITVLINLQNANFPTGTQFVHWVLSTSTGLSFLLGYFKKWKFTPFLMVTFYACLTTLCFIETFDFMTKESRYFLFTIEVVEYILISLYLFYSHRMTIHFKKGAS